MLKNKLNKKPKGIHILKIISAFIFILSFLPKKNDIYYEKRNIAYEMSKYKTSKAIIIEPEIIIAKNFNDILKYAETEKVTFEGTMTGYGPDCKGCSGIVACYPYLNVKNNIYFNDREYGKIRIIAADSKIPCGTMIKVSNLKNRDDFYAIVLDRGGVIKNTLFDLLFSNENETLSFGRNKVIYTIERWGW